MSKYASYLVAAGGLFHLGFAVFHAAFWRLFHWRLDLGRITFLNRQLVQLLNLSMIFMFVLLALLQLAHAKEIATTSVGRTLLGGMALFWLLRGIAQGVFFTWKHRSTYKWGALFLAGFVLHGAATAATLTP
jgi:hypothetical protein